MATNRESFLIGATFVIALAIAVVAATSPAQAFRAKTNRGGVSTLTPFTAQSNSDALLCKAFAVTN